MESLRLYGRILAYLRDYRATVIGAILATIAFAVLDAFSLLMMIPFLNALFGEEPMQVGADNDTLRWLLDSTVGAVLPADAPPARLLAGIIVFVLAVYLLKNAFSFLKSFLVVRLEQGVTRDMRNGVYEHLLELDLRFFGKTRAGQVISRLTVDVDQVRSLITRNIAVAATAALQIVAAVGALMAISVRLTIVALVVLPAMFGIWNRLVRRLRRGDRRVLNLAGEVSSHLQETVSGVRLVKSASAETFERGRFRNLTGDYYRTYVKTETLRAIAGPLSEMMGAIGTVLLLWYGGTMVLVEGALSGAAFVTFLGLSLRLYSPAKQLARLPAQVQPGLAASERIFEFLDAPIEIVDRPGAREFAGVRKAIRFEDVQFHYEPGEPVLQDVNVEVLPGQVIALVGPSGAGKTTLVDLMARFYDPTGGRITVDGVDLREISIASLRRNLGIVTQETVLFHDTVRANIAYGRPEAPQEHVERAARAAHAHEFVSTLPDGYDTVLGERGTRLSGGQRQRIAIARAILRDPPILIFDEATSALDTESERLVQRAVETLLTGRTVFVIAHRLSTVRNADRILVLRQGRIVESGRHDELLSRTGVYRQLYDLQFAGAGG